MNRPALIVASLAVAAALTGCSQPISTSSAPTAPKVSLSAEPSPTSTSAPDFDNAVAFVHALYLDQYDALGQYVADDSVAARYVTHQLAAAEVDSNAGNTPSIDDSDIGVDGDVVAGTIKVEDRSVTPTSHYVYDNFKFSGNKITSWEVKGKPSLDSRLWHAKASDSSKEVKASLVSAYEGNDGSLRVVVNLTSGDVDARIIDASYTPKDGYRHSDAVNGENDIDKHGKTLSLFRFQKSDLGGELKLTVDKIDPNDDSSSYSLTSLSFKVR